MTPLPNSTRIPDEPTPDEAKELAMELLPTCPEHKCVMVRQGTNNEKTGKAAYYMLCPQCQKENRGTVIMEFYADLPVEMTELNIVVDDNGAHIVNWPEAYRE